MSDSEEYASGSLMEEEEESEQESASDQEKDFGLDNSVTVSKKGETLEERRTQALEEVTGVLGITEEDAARLLRRFKWLVSVLSMDACACGNAAHCVSEKTSWGKVVHTAYWHRHAKTGYCCLLHPPTLHLAPMHTGMSPGCTRSGSPIMMQCVLLLGSKMKRLSHQRARYNVLAIVYSKGKAGRRACKRRKKGRGQLIFVAYIHGSIPTRCCTGVLLDHS
eukprot:1148461-Pelagomonas_calceolata.AAC.1